ncbi:PRA1 family protein 1 [Pelomyxa schiedti]|nr:PRA1 family protein 1 [Pelomyxa schiedti]
MRAWWCSLRPWKDFYDMQAFESPMKSTDIVERVLRNLDYYQVNYIAILFFCCVFNMFLHPASLLPIGVWVFSFSYILEQKTATLEIAGKSYTKPQVVYVLSVVSLVFLYATSGLSFVGYVTFGCILVGIHAASRKGTLKAKVVHTRNEIIVTSNPLKKFAETVQQGCTKLENFVDKH